MVKMDIAEWLLSKLDVDTRRPSTVDMHDMVLAVDHNLTSTYKLEKLIPELQRHKHFYKYDVVPYFYKCLIICWLMGYSDFSNFSWGIYIDDKGNINTLPLNVRSAFTCNWFDFKYRYKTMAPEPETMVLIAKDKDYIKALLRIYKDVKTVVDDCVLEGISKFQNVMTSFNDCISFIRNKLNDIEVVLFKSVFSSKEFLTFAAGRSDDLFNTLISDDKTSVYKNFSSDELFGFVSDYYDSILMEGGV